jgi:hypothetical protein
MRRMPRKTAPPAKRTARPKPAARTKPAARAKPAARTKPAARAKPVARTKPAARAKPVARAKPAPAKPAAGPAGGASSEEAPLYTFEHILSKLEPPEPRVRAALLTLQTDEERLALGKNHRSENVLADGARVVSAAFHNLQHGDPEVGSALRAVGVTSTLIAACTAALSELESAHREATARRFTSGARRGAVTSRLSTALSSTKELRDAAWNMLSFVARADAGLRALLASVATVEDRGTDVSRQLGQLADVAEQALRHKGDEVAALVAVRGLEAGAPAAWRAAAESLLVADRDSRALPPTAESAQATLDRLDGLCLLLIRELVRGLDLAWKRAPSLRRPRLYVLRSFLGRPAPKGDGKGSKPAEPSPAKPAPA